MPKEFVDCVNALLKEGKDKSSAYAICTVQYKKRHHGNTPQHDEKMMHSTIIDPTQVTLDDLKLMSWFYEEITRIRQLKGQA